MSEKRITQKEIARRLNMTQAAVSLAMANHPRIPQKTKDRVKALAKKMGYLPDPFLAGLSAYRKRAHPARFQSVLAWITNYPDEEGWRWIPTFYDYYLGAVERAREMGYLVEKFWLRAPGMNHSRMEQILKARNINGIILSPQPEPNYHLDFCFDHFSVVTLGQTLVSPKLNVVAYHQYRSAKRIFKKLLGLGYKRPGLALDHASNNRTDNAWLSGFWSEWVHLPKKNQVPFWLPPKLLQQELYVWLKKCKPDVVVTTWGKVPAWMKQIGEGTAEKTGLALLSVTHPDDGISGIWENPQVIGAKAVEELVEMMHRGERGTPQIPHSVLVDGTWMQGKTVRSISGA